MKDPTFVILTDPASNGFTDRRDLLKTLLQVRELDAGTCETQTAFCDDVTSLTQFLDAYTTAYPELNLQAPDIPPPDALHSIFATQGFQSLVNVHPSATMNVTTVDQLGSIYVFSVENNDRSLTTNDTNPSLKYLQIDALYANDIQMPTPSSFALNIAGTSIYLENSNVDDPVEHSNSPEADILSSFITDSTNLEQLAEEIDDVVLDTDAAEPIVIGNTDPQTIQNADVSQPQEDDIFSSNDPQINVTSAPQETSKATGSLPPAQVLAESGSGVSAARFDESNEVGKPAASVTNEDGLLNLDGSNSDDPENSVDIVSDSSHCDDNTNHDAPNQTSDINISLDKLIESDTNNEILKQIVYPPNNIFNGDLDIEYSSSLGEIAAVPDQSTSMLWLLGSGDKINPDTVEQASLDGASDPISANDDHVELILELGYPTNSNCSDAGSARQSTYTFVSTSNLEDEDGSIVHSISVEIDQ